MYADDTQVYTSLSQSNVQEFLLTLSDIYIYIYIYKYIYIYHSKSKEILVHLIVKVMCKPACHQHTFDDCDYD